MDEKFDVIEDKKNSLVLAMKGERHTFPGLLCWSLLKDKNVKTAVYEVEHPIIGIPKVYIKTAEDETPRKAIQKAVKRIEAELKILERIAPPKRRREKFAKIVPSAKKARAKSVKKATKVTSGKKKTKTKK